MIRCLKFKSLWFQWWFELGSLRLAFKFRTGCGQRARPAWCNHRWSVRSVRWAYDKVGSCGGKEMRVRGRGGQRRAENSCSARPWGDGRAGGRKGHVACRRRGRRDRWIGGIGRECPTGVRRDCPKAKGQRGRWGQKEAWDGATCRGNKWGVDEKWKRNGDFSSTFVLKKANRLSATWCVEPSSFLTDVVDLFVTRLADKMRSSGC